MSVNCTGLKSSSIRHRWRNDVTRRLGQRMIYFQVSHRIPAVPGNCRNEQAATISTCDWMTKRDTTGHCGVNRWTVQVQLMLVLLIRQRWRIQSIVPLFGVAAGRRLDFRDGVPGGGTKMATVMTQWWRHRGIKVDAMLSVDHILGVNFIISWPDNIIIIMSTILTFIIVQALQ